MPYQSTGYTSLVNESDNFLDQLIGTNLTPENISDLQERVKIAQEDNSILEMRENSNLASLSSLLSILQDLSNKELKKEIAVIQSLISSTMNDTNAPLKASIKRVLEGAKLILAKATRVEVAVKSKKDKQQTLAAAANAPIAVAKEVKSHDTDDQELDQQVQDSSSAQLAAESHMPYMFAQLAFHPDKLTLGQLHCNGQPVELSEAEPNILAVLIAQHDEKVAQHTDRDGQEWSLQQGPIHQTREFFPEISTYSPAQQIMLANIYSEMKEICAAIIQPEEKMRHTLNENFKKLLSRFSAEHERKSIFQGESIFLSEEFNNYVENIERQDDAKLYSKLQEHVASILEKQKQLAAVLREANEFIETKIDTEMKRISESKDGKAHSNITQKLAAFLDNHPARADLITQHNKVNSASQAVESLKSRSDNAVISAKVLETISWIRTDYPYQFTQMASEIDQKTNQVKKLLEASLATGEKVLSALKSADKELEGVDLNSEKAIEIRKAKETLEKSFEEYLENTDVNGYEDRLKSVNEHTSALKDLIDGDIELDEGLIIIGKPIHENIVENQSQQNHIQAPEKSWWGYIMEGFSMLSNALKFFTLETHILPQESGFKLEAETPNPQPQKRSSFCSASMQMGVVSGVAPTDKNATQNVSKNASSDSLNNSHNAISTHTNSATQNVAGGAGQGWTNPAQTTQPSSHIVIHTLSPR